MNLKVIISATLFAMSISASGAASAEAVGADRDGVRPSSMCTNVWDCPRPGQPGEAGPTEPCDETRFMDLPHCQDGAWPPIFEYFFRAGKAELSVLDVNESSSSATSSLVTSREVGQSRISVSKAALHSNSSEPGVLSG